MARTFKDKPSKLKYDPYWKDRYVIRVDYEILNRYLFAKTTKTKKRKEVDTKWHWMTTPSWWTRLTMNRPQRREVHTWERKALVSDIEELVQPSKKYKHVYYW